MVDNIYFLASELKDLLDNDPRIIRLNELENKLVNNEEVMALTYQKDVAVSDYSDALNHFADKSEEMKHFRHALFAKKEALDSHPLVREYLEAYSEVRDLYFQINETLFGGLSTNMKPHKENK